MAHRITDSNGEGSPVITRLLTRKDNENDEFESYGVALKAIGKNTPKSDSPSLSRIVHKQEKKTLASELVESELSSTDTDEEEKERRKQVLARASTLSTRTRSLSSLPKQTVPSKSPRSITPKDNKSKHLPRSTSLRDHKEEPNRFQRLTKACSFRKKKSSQLCCVLTTPVLTREGWCRKALRMLEQLARRNPELNTYEVVMKFIEVSLKSTTIINRIKEAQGKQDLPFLTPFRVIYEPNLFLQRAKQLNKSKEYPIFLEVVGGKTALTLLKLCLDLKVHQEWVDYLNKVRILEKACAKIETQMIRFKPGFDKERPIANAMYDDVRDSFRFFFSSDFDRSKSFFCINGTSFQIPAIDTSTSKMEQKEAFITWLITCFDQALAIETKLSPAEQARLVCRGALSAEKKKALQEKLAEVLKDKGTGKLEHILRRLNKAGFPKVFTRWAQERLKQFLKIKGDDDHHDWNRIAQNVISNFQQYYDLSILKQEVPSYYILQSLSFGAFSTVPIFLRLKHSPNLFSNSLGVPQMKSFATDPTHFDIKVDTDTHQFEATQVKRYRFFYQRGRTEASHILLGNVELHWTVCGTIGQDTRSAKLYFHNLHFDNRESLDLRRQVIERFGIGIL